MLFYYPPEKNEDFECWILNISHWKVASGGQGKCCFPTGTRMVEDLKISN
jgi:hypothetical protein